jgi:drug/metabolite transporter (DMT)-like permease
MQNCVFTGVSYSSPTLASAMSNLVPAFTFLLAVIFRFFSSPYFFHFRRQRGREVLVLQTSRENNGVKTERFG